MAGTVCIYPVNKAVHRYTVVDTCFQNPGPLMPVLWQGQEWHIEQREYADYRFGKTWQGCYCTGSCCLGVLSKKKQKRINRIISITKVHIPLNSIPSCLQQWVLLKGPVEWPRGVRDL